MKEYKLLESWDASELVKEVEQHLNRGWTLVGGIAITSKADTEYPGTMNVLYVQAMIRTQVM